MNSKKINPAAIIALKDALSSIYWYKKDLRTFLTNTIKDQAIFSWINWDDYKRNIVHQLINLMTKNENRYQEDLINLMLCVSDFEDFSHLKHLEDGKQKIQQAQEAVNRLRKLTLAFESKLKEEIKAEEHKKRTEEKRKQKTAIIENLNTLCNIYCNLISYTDKQKRGYELEKIIGEDI